MANSPSERAKISREVYATLSKDPLSVQFLWPWFWSMLPGHSPVTDSLPWMTFRAIRWLKSYLSPEMTVFEYGAGGSTLFLAKRVRVLTSIENDARWHAAISHALQAAGISNCDIRLIPAQRRVSMERVRYGPRSYTSTDPELAGLSLEGYVRSIDEFPDRTFDLVSVDGHARFSCVTHAVPKLREGGYLLFDNSDWQIYGEIVRSLDNYSRTDFPGPGPFQPTGWRTSIWRM